jgi:DNA helicase HerA-like ATPase
MVATRRWVSIDRTSRSATKVMFRSANAASNAREVSGDGGTGVSSGRMSVISQALRMPRVAR